MDHQPQPHSNHLSHQHHFYQPDQNLHKHRPIPHKSSQYHQDQHQLSLQAVPTSPLYSPVDQTPKYDPSNPLLLDDVLLHIQIPFLNQILYTRGALMNSRALFLKSKTEQNLMFQVYQPHKIPEAIVLLIQNAYGKLPQLPYLPNNYPRINVPAAIAHATIPKLADAFDSVHAPPDEPKHFLPEYHPQHVLPTTNVPIPQ